MNFVWDHFNYGVTDGDRSIEFYEKILGMKLLSDSGVMPERKVRFIMMGYEGSDLKLELKQDLTHEGPIDTGDQAYHLCVRTDSIEEFFSKCRSLGIVKMEFGHGGFITDPDGHLIEVMAL